MTAEDLLILLLQCRPRGQIIGEWDRIIWEQALSEAEAFIRSIGREEELSD